MLQQNDFQELNNHFTFFPSNSSVFNGAYHSRMCLAKKTAPLPLSIEPNIKSKFQQIWYAKLAESKEKAVCECVAQEILRLLRGKCQQKTRLMKKDGNYYILSKGIPNFQNLHDNQPNFSELYTSQTSSSKQIGLGELSVFSFLLGEGDLRLMNMSLNNGQISKIDGDFCFTSAPTQLTASDIDNLPACPSAFYPSHVWLDTYFLNAEGVPIRPHPDSRQRQLSKTPSFREEVNGALLQTILFTDNLIDKFCATYAEEPLRIPLASTIKRAKNNLKIAALANKSFRSFVLSEQAQTHLEEHIERFSEFCPKGKNTLFDKNDMENIRFHFDNILIEVQTAAEESEKQQTTLAAQTIIKQREEERQQNAMHKAWTEFSIHGFT